jgi:uncharacterized membrane protein YbhN (UPF0104 family)
MIDREERSAPLEPTGSSNSRAWHWLSKIIILAGILWVLFIFAREFSSLRGNFRIANGWWLAYSIIAGVVALLLTLPIFRLLLTFYGGGPISYAYCGRLLFVAQILRHLPGRIVGVLYLIKETRSRIPPVAMIRANLDLMLYSMTFNLLIAGMLVLAELVSGLSALLFSVASLLILLLAIKHDWIGMVLRKAVRIVPAKAAQYADALTPHEPLPWRTAIMIIFFYVLIWCVYLSIWWALPKIFPGLADVNIWLLCASYSSAWVLGYLAMITPSGLGVREAGFIAMSATLTSLATLTFLAVFLRLWQIVVELLVFFAFVFVRPDTATDKITADRKPV